MWTMRISRDVAIRLAVHAWLFATNVGAQGAGLVTDGNTTGTTPESTPPGVTTNPTTETTATTAADRTQTPEPTHTGTHWELPAEVKFNQPAGFDFYTDPALLKDPSKPLNILLVQTNAQPPEAVTYKNSWIVVQLPPCKNVECGETIDSDSTGRYPMSWTFELNHVWDNYANYENFFLCVVKKEADGAFNCQSFSDFFDIETNEPSAVGDGENVQSGANDASGTGGRGTDFQNSDTNPIRDQNGNIVMPKPGSGNAGAQSDLQLRTPSGSLVLPMTQWTPIVTYQNMPETRRTGLPVPPVPSTTQLSVTVTLMDPTATTAATLPSAGGGDKKLATGAIVGIALGVLVLLSILAALALFFCLKRRRQGRNGAEKHEQVMLTHSHGENNSQDLLAEKDAVVTTLIHPNSNDSSFSSHHDQSSARQTLIPVGEIGRHHSTRSREPPAIYHDSDDTRDIQLTPFTSHNDHSSPPIAPYSAGAASNAPRRNPTNASQAPSAVSALSRNTSSSTTASLQRSSSVDYVHHTLQDIGEENPSSTNVATTAPRYGDARHTPTFHTGGADGGVSIVQHGNAGNRSSSVGTSGYLHASEPGMSAEEVARLEEEERRIDEAIAAADEARERERGLR